MAVYVIGAGATDKAKIGWASRDVEGRRVQLQSGCWEPLSILRIMEGSLDTEKWMHRHFRAHHIARDWFRFVPEMLTVEPPEIVFDGHQHSAVIEAFGGVGQLARAIGVRPGLAVHWRRRGIPAKFWPLVVQTDVAKQSGLTALALFEAAA